jgi:hypothetical protein
MTGQKLCSLCGVQEPCGCVVSTLNAVVNEVIDLTFELKAQWKRTYEFHESIGKRMLSLEQMCKADAEVAKDIIFEGARHNEEIRQVRSENDTHCGAISVLESQIKKINEVISKDGLIDRQQINEVVESFKSLRSWLNGKFNDIHDWERVMTEGSSSLVVRLDKIEKHIKVNNNIELGNLERINAIEECINRITEDDMKSGRQPYKCPICNGLGTSQTDMETCNGCDDRGIVWG